MRGKKGSDSDVVTTVALCNAQRPFDHIIATNDILAPITPEGYILVSQVGSVTVLRLGFDVLEFVADILRPDCISSSSSTPFGAAHCVPTVSHTTARMHHDPDKVVFHVV